MNSWWVLWAHWRWSHSGQAEVCGYLSHLYPPSVLTAGIAHLCLPSVSFRLGADYADSQLLLPLGHVRRLTLCPSNRNTGPRCPSSWFPGSHTYQSMGSQTEYSPASRLPYFPSKMYLMLRGAGIWMLCFVFLSRCVVLDMIVIPKVSFQPGLVVLACKPSTWTWRSDDLKFKAILS